MEGQARASALEGKNTANSGPLDLPGMLLGFFGFLAAPISLKVVASSTQLL